MSQTIEISRDQELANELEEMRIDMLIDVGLCVEERYQDYCGKIINQQFRELAHKMRLPKRTSTTAAAFARYLPASSEPDEESPPAPTHR